MTDQMCTQCGKGFKEGDDLYVTSAAIFEDRGLGMPEVYVSDTPYYTIACDECGEKITEAIESMGVELALEAELSRYKELVEKYKTMCTLILEDCELALSDNWDRGDEGFQAMRDNMIDVLETAERVEQGAQSEEYKGFIIHPQVTPYYAFIVVDREGKQCYTVKQPAYETLKDALDGAKWDIDYDLGEHGSK